MKKKMVRGPLLVETTAKSRENEHEPSAQHLETEIHEVDAELERAVGQGLREPHHPPEHGRPQRRGENRRP